MAKVRRAWVVLRPKKLKPKKTVLRFRDFAGHAQAHRQDLLNEAAAVHQPAALPLFTRETADQLVRRLYPAYRDYRSTGPAQMQAMITASPGFGNNQRVFVHALRSIFGDRVDRFQVPGASADAPIELD
jgi:hypothetical protein